MVFVDTFLIYTKIIFNLRFILQVFGSLLYVKLNYVFVCYLPCI